MFLAVFYCLFQTHFYLIAKGKREASRSTDSWYCSSRHNTKES